MSEFYSFAGEHPWLVFGLAFLLIHYPFKFYNRWMRHKNIAASGWPPAHVDADGLPNRRCNEE